MGKRDGLVQAYVAALGMRGIRVVVAFDGSARSQAQIVDIKDHLDVRPRMDLRVFDLICFTKSAHADIVHQYFLQNAEHQDMALPDGWLKHTPSQCRDGLIDLAASLGAPWRTCEEILLSAGEAVLEVERKVEAMRTSGGLAQVNAEFKSYRKRMQMIGQPAIPYSAFLAKFTLALVELVATKANLGGTTQFGDLTTVARQVSRAASSS